MSSKKLIWSSEEPVVDGLYWFDSGLRGTFGPIVCQPMLLKVSGAHRFVSGKGSADLSFVYNEELWKKRDIKAYFAPIPKPNEWESMFCIKEQDTRAWFKAPNGYMGIGINLRPESYAGSGYYVAGDFIWEGPPGATYSDSVHQSKGYMYSIIDVPDVPVPKRRRK